MLFNSTSFLLFFPIVTIIYFLLPSKGRTLWLLAASYYFYMSWNVKYAVLILTSTVITYVSGILIERFRDKSLVIVRSSFVLCLLSNLSILFVFKYLNFAISTLHLSLKPLSLLLPVGISFYTFQALGYVIDVYRGTTTAEKNFVKYALFVSFYPQLVAGPIERSTNLLNQISVVPDKTRRELLNYQRICEGLSLMLWGMFMKLAIADRIGTLVDTIFDNYYRHGRCALIIGAVGFGIQIYCDFGSYSAIAIGSAKVMGFSLMDNFKAPYFATSITDFWRRWHVSLSIWFRDYLYIPLGGNRKGTIRKMINLLITFLVSGLWHGAAWTFVLWGLLHGIYHVIESLLKPVWRKICSRFDVNTNNFGYRFSKIAITFVLVDFAWIFFRTKTVGEAFYYIKRMVMIPDYWMVSGDALYSLGLSSRQFHLLILSLLLLLFVDLIYQKKKLRFDEWIFTQWTPFRVVFLALLLMWVIVFGSYGPGFSSRQFIYFQF
ncbi:MBOAT family O-acyltransferase [Butyrivibrio proteoclasticus]|uniref:MBOAT family O-acyltransferase n=1 Tax=Butyrivibrio proteoclasticus TaxID=43305 RepID=UPI00047C71AC|nr:MBOAT family O-acyltransferase [Butyrivibrio proteoclasticus]